MKKDQKTTSTKWGDTFTGISTVEVLPPEVKKALNIEDVEMVIIIDKKGRKHLRANCKPSKIRVGAPIHLRQDNRVEGMWEEDSPGSGCWWLIQRYAPDEDKTGLYKECLFGEGCPIYDVIDL